jgi:PKD repeat protein
VVSVTPTSPTICSGANVALSAGGATSYSWSPATGLSSTSGASVTANPSTSTTYTVTSNGCSSTQNVTVTVNPELTPEFELTFTSDGYICAGSSVDISAPLGYASYLWSTGATSNSITVNQPGIYALTVVDANGCIGGDDEIEIITDANPVASFTYDQEDGYNIKFNNTSTSGTNFLWDFGGGNTSTQEHPEFTYSFDGIYPITLIVSNSCGSDTLMTTIEVFKLSAGNIALENSIHVYPNPFHESFQVNFDESLIKKNMNISIFNLLGQKVYTHYLTEQASNTFLIEFNNKAQGVYMLQICNNGSCISKRLINN